MSTLCIVLQVVNIAMLVFDVQHYWQIQQCDLALCQMSTDYLTSLANVSLFLSIMCQHLVNIIELRVVFS